MSERLIYNFSSVLALAVGLEILLIPRGAVGLKQWSTWESSWICNLIGLTTLHKLHLGIFDGFKALVEVCQNMAFHVLLKQVLDGLHNLWCVARLIGAIRLQEIRKCSSNWLQVRISGCHWVCCQIGDAGRRGSFSHEKESHQCGEHMRNLHCSGECSEPKVQLICQSPRFVSRRSWAAKRHICGTRARLDNRVFWPVSYPERNHKPEHLLSHSTVIASYIVSKTFAPELISIGVL